MAPGTFGSLPGVLLAWLTLDLGLYVQLGVAAGLFVAESGFAAKVRAKTGRSRPRRHRLGRDLRYVRHTFGGTARVITRFRASRSACFRLFDIVKPWPIRDLDHRLGGGLGIMLDDLVAALYAA